MTLETHFTWCITKGASYHGSLNGVGWNVWEKSQFKVELSLSCKFAVSTVLFWEKYITLNISICASNLLKQESSARWFSPSTWPLLLWLVVLSRHGFCHLLIFSVFPKVLSFFVSAHEKPQDGKITAVICTTIQSLVTAEISDSEIFLDAKVSESERLNRK